LNVLHELLRANNIAAGGRIRITVWRESQGAYLPVSDHSEVLIEVQPLESNTYIDNAPCRLAIYPHHRIAPSITSSFKTTSALPYVLAARYAREKGVDDSLLLGAGLQVVETTRSNIFIVKNKVLYTPPLTSGCLPGVMRRVVMDMAREHGIPCFELTLIPSFFVDASEVFLTNSLTGITPVARIGEIRFNGVENQYTMCDFFSKMLSRKTDFS